MAQRISSQEIVEWVLACKKESEDGRRSKMRWAEKSWRAYYNDVDFSLKADWQSKVSYPAWAMGIEQASNAISQAFKQAVRMFTIEVLNPNDPVEIARAAFTHDVLTELLRQANAAEVLGQAVKVGLITNLQIHKPRVRSEEVTRFAPVFSDAGGERVLGREPVIENKLSLDLAALNPRHFFLDPLGRGLYNIHRALKDKAVLATSDFKNFYRPRAMEAVLNEGDAADNEEDQKERDDQQVSLLRNPARRQVEILEFWGPIYNKQGMRALSNRWVTVLNSKHLAMVEPYPFWHGGDPFVYSAVIKSPFTPYGKPLYQHVSSIGDALNELLCMILDAQKYATLGAFSVDTNLMDDVSEIAEGLFPGITFSGGPQAISQLKFQGADAMSLQLLHELLQGHQNYMGVTEFLQGAPSTRGRATAEEVRTKTSQSAAFFDSLATGLEDTLFSPLLDKSWWNVMQYWDDWSQPMLAAIAAKHQIPVTIMGSDPVTRYQTLKGASRFHAAGLTAVLRRSETLSRLLELLQIIGQSPEMIQRVDIDKVFQRIMEAMNFQDLITQQNALPPVVVPSAMGVQGMQPVPGFPHFAAPAPGVQAPALGEVMQGR